MGDWAVAAVYSTMVMASAGWSGGGGWTVVAGAEGQATTKEEKW